MQGKQSFLNKLAYFYIIFNLIIFDVIIFGIIIFEVIIFDVITFDIIILMSFLIGKLFKPGFIYRALVSGSTNQSALWYLIHQVDLQFF